MLQEAHPQASVPTDTSRSASPSTFTDLQTVQIGGYNILQGAESHTTDQNSQCVNSLFYPGNNQQHEWNQGQYSDAAAMMLPVVPVPENLFLADRFGEGLPNLPSDSPSVSAPLTPPACYHQDNSLGERKPTKGPQKKEVYVKKPLNAFMLFMKEQRPTVRPVIRGKGSGAVNDFLGSIWNSLSRKEQEKYYQAAEKERLLHQQQCPGWSNKDNYSKMQTKAEKKKLQEVMEDAEKESYKPENEETPPSKWMRLTPKYRDKNKNDYSRPDETESSCQMKLRSRKRPNNRK